MELAAAPEQQESADEGEDPHDYSEGHSGQENGIANVAFGVGGEVVEPVSECEGSQEDGHAGDDVQNSHGMQVSHKQARARKGIAPAEPACLY